MEDIKRRAFIEIVRSEAHPALKSFADKWGPLLRHLGDKQLPDDPPLEEAIELATGHVRNHP